MIVDLLIDEILCALARFIIAITCPIWIIPVLILDMTLTALYDLKEMRLF